MDKQDQDRDTWEEAIKKAIDVKAKAACQPQSLIRKIDNQCPWSHWPIKIDESIEKSRDSNKNKSQEQKAQARQSSKNAKISKKV